MEKIELSLDKALIAGIAGWCRDFELTQPRNLCLDEDSFEDSAYMYLQAILASARR